MSDELMRLMLEEQRAMRQEIKRDQADLRDAIMLRIGSLESRYDRLAERVEAAEGMATQALEKVDGVLDRHRDQDNALERKLDAVVLAASEQAAVSAARESLEKEAIEKGERRRAVIAWTFGILLTASQIYQLFIRK